MKKTFLIKGKITYFIYKDFFLPGQILKDNRSLVNFNKNLI